MECKEMITMKETQVNKALVVCFPKQQKAVKDLPGFLGGVLFIRPSRGWLAG